MDYFNLFYSPYAIITIVFLMIKNLFYSLGIITIIILLAGGIILYGRGYRFNLNQKSLTPTGILSVTSTPEGASVWLDGKLTTATNTSISYKPGWYTIRIGKEGYQTWEKKIRIQGEVVTRSDAFLIPNNPSLRALTITGIVSPSLSPMGTKVAYIVPSEEATYSAIPKTKKGVWTMELKNGPLGGKSEPKAIYQPENIKDWSNAIFIWSPDEKQLILKFKSIVNKKETVSSALLLGTDGENLIPQNITYTYKNIENEWQTIQQTRDLESRLALPLSLQQLLDNSTSDIKLSPDETKILYTATQSAVLSPVITPPLIGSNSTEEVRSITPGKLFIYDLKEDKNYYIAEKKAFPSRDSIKWYSDSKHIIMIEKDSIYIMDFDGTNKRAIYTGPFEDEVAYPWTSSGKIVILTNFNKPKSLSNLYEIDLR